MTYSFKYPLVAVIELHLDLGCTWPVWHVHVGIWKLRYYWDSHEPIQVHVISVSLQEWTLEWKCWINKFKKIECCIHSSSLHFLFTWWTILLSRFDLTTRKEKKKKKKTNGHNTVLHAWQSDVILHWSK